MPLPYLPAIWASILDLSLEKSRQPGYAVAKNSVRCDYQLLVTALVAFVWHRFTSPFRRWGSTLGIYNRPKLQSSRNKRDAHNLRTCPATGLTRGYRRVPAPNDSIGCMATRPRSATSAYKLWVSSNSVPTSEVLPVASAPTPSPPTPPMRARSAGRCSLYPSRPRLPASDLRVRAG